jgi:hypothetical protein
MIIRPMLLLGVCLAPIVAQSLQITSPAGRTIVHPGDSLKVRVSASGRFEGVVIIGFDPIGFSNILPAPPYEFTIQIPQRITPGPYLITADGYTTPGEGASSESIALLVEDDRKVKLRVEPPSLELALGHLVHDGYVQHGYLNVVGMLPFGERLYLTKSTYTTFTSSAPKIATVDAHSGLVTPVAPGSAKIIVKYRGSTVEVPVVVSR